MDLFIKADSDEFKLVTQSEMTCIMQHNSDVTVDGDHISVVYDDDEISGAAKINWNIINL
jgi:hypothetical protein